MGKLTDAMTFAIAAHGDAKRKGDGTPAIFHAMEAAAVAATLTTDEDVLAAAVLHDTVEDCGATPDELRARFGDRVADLVAAETEDKMRHLPPAESWYARKKAAVARLRAETDPGAAAVTLGDKLSNMRAFYRGKRRLGGAMWDAFNQKDPAAHHWYYRAIADALSGLSDTPAWQEYDRLIRLVFDEDKTDPEAAGETRRNPV